MQSRNKKEQIVHFRILLAVIFVTQVVSASGVASEIYAAGFKSRVDGCHDIEHSDWSGQPRVMISLAGLPTKTWWRSERSGRFVLAFLFYF